MESYGEREAEFYLDKIKETFEQEPNNFVKLCLKSFLNKSLDTFDFSELENLSASDQLKKDLTNLFNELKNKSSIESNSIVAALKSFISKLDFKKEFLWEMADFLLKLPSIMKLSRYDSEKLVNLIKDLKSTKQLENFIREKCESNSINRIDLENEIKKVNKKYNLTTIINQIYKKKPPAIKPLNIHEAEIGITNPNNLASPNDRSLYKLSTCESDGINAYSKDGQNNSNKANLKTDAFNVLEKEEEINKIKDTLILELLRETPGQVSLFDFLIKESLRCQGYLFSNEGILRKISLRERGNLVLEKVQNLLEIRILLGKGTNKLDILNEILNEANYTRYIKSNSGMNTERLIRTLSEGKNITDQMEGKTIIAFFGNTGSGKSTTVNYFAGIPLKKTVSNYGDEIIKIDEEENHGNSAKIGHSLVTSETLYAQAYKIIENTYDEEIISNQRVNDTLLCDNPGFKDTRGTNYEICTHLSIDQAISNCRKLQAAVLVLPFNVFSLDRGNHIFEAIMDLEDRFPDLLTIESDTFKNFFIAITKYNSESQQEGFEDRLTQHLQEEIKSKTEFERNNDRENNIRQDKRIRILNCLYNLNKSRRILFINAEDRALRSEYLLEILKGDGIQKSKYNRTLRGARAIKTFVSEISKTAKCWCDQILSDFLTVLPQDLMSIMNKIVLNNHGRENFKIKKTEMFKIKNQIDETKRIITALTLRNTLLEKDLVEISEQIEMNKPPNLAINQVNLINNYESEGEVQSEIGILAEKILEEKEILENLETELVNAQNELKLVESELAEKQEILEKLSTGETCQTLLDVRFSYGQEINYSLWESGERELCFNELRESENVGYNKTVFAGFCIIDFWMSSKVKMDYPILKEKTDLEGESVLSDYINSSFFKTQFDLHRAEVTGIKTDESRKEVVIQYKLFFDICEDLPFIRIKHYIPNSLFNQDQIIRADFEILQLKTNLTNIKQNVIELGLGIIETKSKIMSIEDKRIKLKKYFDQSLKLIATKNKINSNLTKLLRLNLELDNYEKQTNEMDKEFKRLENKNEELERKEAQKVFELRKLSLLVFEQIEKKIPQSLFEFMNIAYEIENQPGVRESVLNETERESFEKFRKLYSGNKSDIRERALEYLGLDYFEKEN